MGLGFSLELEHLEQLSGLTPGHPAGEEAVRAEARPGPTCSLAGHCLCRNQWPRLCFSNFFSIAT